MPSNTGVCVKYHLHSDRLGRRWFYSTREDPHVAAITPRYQDLSVKTNGLVLLQSTPISVSTQGWRLLFYAIIKQTQGAASSLPKKVFFLWSSTLIIVISRSELRDRDWSNTRHVMCKNIQCCPVVSCCPGNMILSCCLIGKDAYW